MNPIHALLERKLATLDTPTAVVLPGGQRFGAADPRITLRLHEAATLAHIATGEVGKVAQDHVEGRIDFDGSGAFWYSAQKAASPWRRRFIACWMAEASSWLKRSGHAIAAPSSIAVWFSR